MGLVEEWEKSLDPGTVLTGADMSGYLTDWKRQYVSTPLAVLRPSTTEAVSQIVRDCAAAGVAVVPVSGNTGLNGGTYSEGSVMISMERMNKILEIRTDARVAVVEAGVVLSQLHDAVAAVDLVFPLTFGARGSAMIGGCLSTNAGGSNVLRYGNTRALCLGLEAVLADGRTLDLMNALHKDNTGFDLKDLLIGAEGTLGLITKAVLKLSPTPIAHATAMVAPVSVEAALVLLNKLQAATSGAVEAFEYMPRVYIEKHLELISGAREPFEAGHAHNVMVEIATTKPEDGKAGPDGKIPLVTQLEEVLASALEHGLLENAVIAQSETQRQEIWHRREDAAEITLTGVPIVDSDIAVPLEQVGPFLEAAERRCQEIDPGSWTMVVAHLGDGNVHHTVYPSKDDPELKDALRQAVEELVMCLGGSFSAEHGIGLTKLPSMERRKDKVALDVMRQIKRALDPKNILNPGKVIP